MEDIGETGQIVKAGETGETGLTGEDGEAREVGEISDREEYGNNALQGAKGFGQFLIYTVTQHIRSLKYVRPLFSSSNTHDL